MIFRTDESELTDTLNKHFENTFYGRVFISDQEPDLTHEPGYFNDLQSYISASKARSSENCGCYDTDECQELSVCPVNSECTNTLATITVHARLDTKPNQGFHHCLHRCRRMYGFSL